ncbi:hypothetical protein MMAD_26650 [Mycolicibacterium madagascariense]|uniref:Secreted protein n=1 Tax=Mycolicibacterium madagascariense TaxID=212765 RepID=A0A7I7XGN5_9MYCO|nr:hypothetical protein [Mycolicibacterium madagascariense]MCV7013317.1 hypothetical protein [Mycolicibacterium madagascariense]BBZ28370.1 hypothetical protein MMAD_26650 [Mycolicibacterium madagascariense]
MTLKHALLTAAAGSALALAPLALTTVAMPAVGHADKQPKCDEAAVADPAQPAPAPACNQPAPQAQGQGQTLNCPDGTIVDTKYGKCVSLTDGIAKQLRALPAPPGLQGFGNAAGGGGGIGGFNGIPSLGTINLPSVVLPSLGLGLVPDINLNLQPKF